MDRISFRSHSCEFTHGVEDLISALKCFFPGRALKRASFLIAYCSTVAVFNRKINMPITEGLAKGLLACWIDAVK